MSAAPMWLGAHIGIADGLALAPTTGRSIGCEAIQIFSKSPQMWAGPPLADEAAAAFASAAREAGLRATAVHHGYLANLASPKPPMLARSRTAFVDELRRAEKLGVDALIFHCGAHLGSGRDAGLRQLAESLAWAFEQTPGFRVRALLENAAGQGTTLCSSFEEIAFVLGRLPDRSRAGVAIDTCHLFAAGVDFRTPETYGDTIDALAGTVGLGEVRAFHLNDAKADLGSHLDRHANVGDGLIGAEGFRAIVNDPRWKAVPGYLETPLDGDGYGRYVADLAALRGLRGGGPEARAAPQDRGRSRRRAKP